MHHNPNAKPYRPPVESLTTIVTFSSGEKLELNRHERRQLKIGIGGDSNIIKRYRWTPEDL
jgi:hypothetical protein